LYAQNSALNREKNAGSDFSLPVLKQKLTADSNLWFTQNNHNVVSQTVN